LSHGKTTLPLGRIRARLGDRSLEDDQAWNRAGHREEEVSKDASASIDHKLDIALRLLAEWCVAPDHQSFEGEELMTSNQQLPTIDQVREARRLLDKQDEGEAMVSSGIVTMLSC
jgi:hypothetical protein